MADDQIGKKTLRGLFKRCLFKARLHRLGSFSNRFYILPYHMVAGEPNGFYPETPISNFKKQMAYLARNHEVTSLDEMVRRVKKKEPLRRCVAVTFDDGFKDNYKNAYPILREYNIPATIFLTTGYIESGNAPWFIKLRYIFMKTEKAWFRFSTNDKVVLVPMRTKPEKFAASERAMAYLKGCPDGERLALLDRLCEELRVREFEEIKDLMLDWHQIKEMSENGISFGAHTVSHPVLATMPLGLAEKEISESRKTIEEKIGSRITSFAYPFGKKAQYRPELFPILERLQFKCAVTAEWGANNYHTCLFALNRGVPWEVGMVA